MTTLEAFWDHLSTESPSIAAGWTAADLHSTGRAPGHTADYDMNWTSSPTITEVSPPEPVVTVVFILGILLNVAGVIGNILVLVIIASTRELRQTYNICLASLSVNDLILCLFTNITMAVGIWLRAFPLGSPFCLLHNMLWSHLIFVSFLNISLISLLRYLLVVHQKASHLLNDNKYILLSIIVALHFLTFFLISFDKIGKETWFDANMGLCWIVGDTSSRVYMSTAALILGIIITLFSYLGIYRRVKAQRRIVNTISNPSNSEMIKHNLQRNTHHMKIVQCMLIIIFATLLITALPFISLSVLLKHNTIPLGVHLLVPIFSWIFNLSNSIIYCLNDKAFRKGYKTLKCKVRVAPLIP